MKTSQPSIKIVLFTLCFTLLASCVTPPTVPASTRQTNSTATPSTVPTSTWKPSPTATPDLIGTLVASAPILDISFNGAECAMSGPREVPIGTLVLRFVNTSGVTATPWIARNYPGKTWQDVLNSIGEPGSFVADTWNWIALLGYDRSVSESPTTSYRQYNLKLAAEYHIVVEYPTDHLWPCGPFFVLSSE